jgi:tRNA U34 5-methylaminomethyl-2-thiouridine-forming methyltransferase MnmC
LFEEIDDLDRFDLIYFDAFGYRVQPELWYCNIQNVHSKNNGVLVTYAARGVVKEV